MPACRIGRGDRPEDQMLGLRSCVNRNKAPAFARPVCRLPVKALASSIAIAALLALSPAASAQPDLWERAHGAYETQHFSLAISLYEQLAQGGSPQAAEIAGSMLLYGEALYGNDVPRDTARAVRLLQQAAGDGSPTAQFLLDRIHGAPIALTTAGEEPVDSWSEASPFEAAPRAD
jgi:TPR repeat protein